MNKDTPKEYIYGIHTVLALLKARPKNVSVIYLARKKHEDNSDEIMRLAEDAGIRVENINPYELDAMLAGVNHQGIAAKINTEATVYDEQDLLDLLANLKEPAFFLVLDSVQDPHNLGACLRVANAAGVHAVIAPKDRAVGLTPAVSKVASGAAETTPFVQVTNLVRTMQILQKEGVWFYGACEKAEKNIYQTDFKGSTALVLGAEGSGLRRLTRDTCDFLISIPMFGTVSSLNVSVAAGVCLFEAVRQRTLPRL
jgi:23S rRNA (guanosine2251-2'-O)-methyltransferase